MKNILWGVIILIILGCSKQENICPDIIGFWCSDFSYGCYTFNDDYTYTWQWINEVETGKWSTNDCKGITINQETPFKTKYGLYIRNITSRGMDMSSDRLPLGFRWWYK